jgi:hypothetical protein
VTVLQQTTASGLLVSNCPSPPKSYVLIWPLYPQNMLSIVKVKVKLPWESTCWGGGKDRGKSCPGPVAKVTLSVPPRGKPDPRMVTCWLGTPCLGTPDTVACEATGAAADGVAGVVPGVVV